MGPQMVSFAAPPLLFPNYYTKGKLTTERKLFVLARERKKVGFVGMKGFERQLSDCIRFPAFDHSKLVSWVYIGEKARSVAKERRRW